MALNLATIEQDMAKHIAAMARVEGFKDYARQRLRELVSEEQGLWVNLPALVKKELENGNN